MTVRARPRLGVALVVLASLVTLAAWLYSRDGRAPNTTGTRPPGGRRSLLVISVDTLRADHLGSYGYGRPTSPAIDALAAQGMLFESVTTPRPKTAPSMTSLLTGLYPHEHGVRTNFGHLPDVRLALDPTGPLRPDPESPALLAERLSAAGLATGAVVSNYVLTAASSGLARGFASYDDEMTSSEATRADVPERKARDTTDAAVAWLGEHADEPFFLWVHYIDPHGAYAPPAEHDLFHGPAGERVPLGLMREPRPLSEDGHRIFVAVHNLLRDAAGKRVLDGGRYVDLYDGEIHYTDHEIGRLVDELRRLGRDADTLVVLTADHGESLGEHGVWFEHGYDLYEPSLRLPLVVRLPEAAGGARGVRRTEPVDLIDVGPTALEWLRLEPEPGLAGVSLLGALDAERITFTERLEFGFVQRAARSLTWKLVHNDATPDPETWPLFALRELYDLAADPGETTNLYDSDDPRVAAARARLEPALAEWTRAAEERGAADEREELASLSPERRRALQGLGYAGDTAPQPVAGASADERRPPETDDPSELLAWALERGGASRALALEALARWGGLDLEHLAARLAPSEPLDVRVRAAELAGELGVESLYPVMEELAREAPEASLRLAAAQALARAAGGSLEPLLAGATHWSASVRAQVAWSLDRLGAPEAARPALRALAKDRAGTVRVLALRALARAGETGALDALADETMDVDPGVERAAGLALAELGATALVRQLARALQADEHPLRQATGEELLAWIDLGEARLALARRAEHSPQQRRRLVHVGGLRAGGNAEALLIEALHDDDIETRAIAAMHLLRRRSGG